MTIFERIMKVRRGVVFRWQDGMYGSCWPTDSETVITINLARHERGDPVKTFVHECIHILYPKLSHDMVFRVERRVWNQMTSKERFLLAKKLYNRKWRTR